MRIPAFVAGAATLGAVMGLFALAVVELGLYDTSATKPHNLLVSWAAHATFTHATQLRAQAVRAPETFTQEQVRAGFSRYQQDCVMCHGGPGVSRAPWVRGLTPTPPFLMDAAYRWTPAQLGYILEHGVKMSAMPAWGAVRTPAQIWELVAFLEALPDLSPSDFQRLADTPVRKSEPATARPPAGADPGRHP